MSTHDPCVEVSSISAPATSSTEKIAFSSFIGQNYAGSSVLDFLSHRFRYFEKERWQKLIDEGDVLLNGKTVCGEEILKNNDEVCYLAMTRAEPKVPKEIAVLYEDQDLLIVNKPPHLPVHPTGRYLRNTLINILKKQKALDFLVLSHRLDRETSGVCVLSKTHLAKEKMYWQFFNYETEKVYWALVWGQPHPSSGLIDAPIGNAKNQGSKIRIKQAVKGAESKNAKTHYKTKRTKWIDNANWRPPSWPGLRALLEQKGLEKGPPWPISLVECKPKTGRTNQIRVHLAHLGAGLVGDKLYDPDEEVFLRFKDQRPRLDGDRKPGYVSLDPELEARLVLDAHALHAKSLKFRHPRTGKMIKIEAPPPKSWKGLY